ncbi:uncharacterized protein [Lepidochelys kempii]|uniref:uncharacterized protein isoform X1 n=1 Tax=Lepidochelys kempii TaxID=8472 RepID=UPI003C704E73
MILSLGPQPTVNSTAPLISIPRENTEPNSGLAGGCRLELRGTGRAGGERGAKDWDSRGLWVEIEGTLVHCFLLSSVHGLLAGHRVVICQDLVLVSSPLYLHAGQPFVLTGCDRGDMAQSDRSTVGSRPVTGSLVPRKDSPGTDIFRNLSGDCIVRSDLGCYLQMTEFLEKGHNIKIQGLHPACLGGDHYVGSRQDPNIYIIKGSSYRVVQDLSTDKGAQVFELHPRCRGGDHYGRVCWTFFIIFQNQGVIHSVKNLRIAEGENNVVLPPEYCKGLYYFGIDHFLTLIKMDEKRGAQFFLYPDMRFDKLDSFYSIHPKC